MKKEVVQMAKLTHEERYVCYLTAEKEEKILAIARERLAETLYDSDIIESLGSYKASIILQNDVETELENVANSKVCDLTDLIPYEVLREIVEG